MKCSAISIVAVVMLAATSLASAWGASSHVKHLPQIECRSPRVG